MWIAQYVKRTCLIQTVASIEVVLTDSSIKTLNKAQDLRWICQRNVPSLIFRYSGRRFVKIVTIGLYTFLYLRYCHYAGFIGDKNVCNWWKRPHCMSLRAKLYTVCRIMLQLGRTYVSHLPYDDQSTNAYTNVISVKRVRHHFYQSLQFNFWLNFSYNFGYMCASFRSVSMPTTTTFLQLTLVN